MYEEHFSYIQFLYYVLSNPRIATFTEVSPLRVVMMSACDIVIIGNKK
jgi:hypothetical protein